MAGNSAFIPVAARGRLGGLNNLLRAEFGIWFGTNMWWTQGLMWIVILNFLVGALLWSEAGVELVEAVTLYGLFSGLFPAVAVVIILQDAIVGEVEKGTAAWVLSKPVSREAFVLAKLIPNAVGVLVSMVLLPGLAAYAQFSAKAGAPLPPLGFLAGLLAIWLVLLYYLTLTLMLGTFFKHRAPVIGLPLAVVFGQQMIIGLAPFLAQILPWGVFAPPGDAQVSLASALFLGQPLPGSVLPLIALALSIIVFTGAALWRFGREEF